MSKGFGALAAIDTGMTHLWCDQVETRPFDTMKYKKSDVQE